MQILVAVAAIQVQALKTEVEQVLLRTAIGGDSDNPEAKAHALRQLACGCGSHATCQARVLKGKQSYIPCSHGRSMQQAVTQLTTVVGLDACCASKFSFVI